MKMNERNLFQIGEVARMFHISPGTLRHYEQAGILIPEFIDEQTGYRYYGVRQFEVLNTIRYLRVLDLPLKQIADFVQNRNIDSICEKLRQQQEIIDQKQRELEIVRRKIGHRLHQIEDARTSLLEQIELKPISDLRIAWISTSLKPHSYLDLEYSIRRLERGQRESMVFLGKVGVGISKERLRHFEDSIKSMKDGFYNADGDCESGSDTSDTVRKKYGNQEKFDCYDRVFLVLDEEEVFDGETERIPAGICAVVRFCGSHKEAPDYYRRLLAYLKEHRLNVNGFSREITLIDEGMTDDPSQFVTEIQIPVKSLTDSAENDSKDQHEEADRNVEVTADRKE